MALTVRQFINRVYGLITASNPVVPVGGTNEIACLDVMNMILNSYSSSGLLQPIAKTVSVNVNLGIKNVFFTDPGYTTVTTRTEVVSLTTGSPAFNVIDGSVYFVGDLVSGVGIPAGSSILSVVGNLVTITANATVTNTSNLTFTHDIADPSVAYIKEGRLANLDSAWLLLSGVTYPLIDKSRDEYLAAWKYEPLQGLPRFIITFPQNDYVSSQLYPAPSQFYQFFARGKFKLGQVTINDDLSLLPDYYELYFIYAVARYVCKFTARSSAWTQDLEDDYRELKAQIEGASEINLSIAGDEQSLLNGAWRVRAGI